MSMTPNNPFEDPQNDQGYVQSPPPKKGGKGCLIGCAVAGLLGVLFCCGGGGYLAHYGVSMLAGESMTRGNHKPSRTARGKRATTHLSCALWPECVNRIAPIDPVEHVGELGGRDRHAAAGN